MTLKTRVMMLKIQLCITGINDILKYIQIEISCFKFLQDFAALLNIRDFFQKLLSQSHLFPLLF